MPQLASVMIRVFPSLEHSTDCVRKPADNFRTFVCVPYWHLWTKHNRAKPMFELPSAIFLIADGNEFRFARFYIVCEEVPLGTPESPLIVCGLSDTLRECPNVERHGMGCQPRHGRNTWILLQRICRRLFILELFCLWYSCNITYQSKERYALLRQFYFMKDS